MGKIEWTTLHDVAYVYFVMGSVGAGEAFKDRIPILKKKFLELPLTIKGMDNEIIFQEAANVAIKDMKDSMDPVFLRLESCVNNVKELSKESLNTFIKDLFYIINSASPTDAEIEQLNHTADFFGVETVKRNNTENEPWTLLHDMAYLYQIVAVIPMSASKDKNKLKLRFDAVLEKISEWPSGDLNHAQLVTKIAVLVVNDIKNGLSMGEKIDEIVAKIMKYMPEDNHKSVLEDLIYITNAWSPNKSDDIKALKYIADLMEIDFDSFENKGDSIKKVNKTTGKSKNVSNETDPAGNLTAKGVLAGTQEKWDEAEKLFTEAIRINQSCGAAYRYRAIARDNLNNLEGAIKDLDKCIELDVGDAEAYRIRGRMKGRLGKDLEATEDFSNSIKHEKDKDKLSMSYRLRGYAQYQLKDYKNAISDYDQAIKLESKNAESYYFRGLCKQKIELETDAMRDLQKAAELGFEEAKKLINKAAQEKDHEPKDQKGLQHQLPSNEKKEYDEGASKGKRTTYTTWLEFEKEQSAKDQIKKRFMPIAKNIHELITSTFKENKMPFEVRYGDGTFSFSVPQDLAKSKKRTCARCGLLNFKMDSSYIESLYKDADDELPKGAKLRKKEDSTEYFYNFASPDDFEKAKNDIKKGIVRSYKILAK